MKLVSNLLILCYFLRTFLNKESVYYLTDYQTLAYEELKMQIVNINVTNISDIKKKTRLKTDALHSGIESNLEQWHEKSG